MLITCSIGSLALAALPLTSGFYSKDAILLTSFDYAWGGPLFWAAAAAAAFVTALYTTRMMLITFFGESKTEPHDHSGINMKGPLVILAVLAVGGGWFGLSPVGSVLPDGGLSEQDHTSAVALATMAAPILGILVGLLFFSGRVDRERLANSRVGDVLGRFWFGGWGFDWLYDRLFVAPFVWLARVNKPDAVDFVYRGTVVVMRRLHQVVVLTQTGRLRWYAVNMAVGLAVVFLLAGVL